MYLRRLHVFCHYNWRLHTMYPRFVKLCITAYPAFHAFHAFPCFPCMQYREECLPLPVAEWRKSQLWRNPAATRENTEKTSLTTMFLLFSICCYPTRFQNSPREDSCLSHCHESSSGIFKPCEKNNKMFCKFRIESDSCVLWKSWETQSSSLLAHAILKHEQMTLWRLNRPTEPSFRRNSDAKLPLKWAPRVSKSTVSIKVSSYLGDWRWMAGMAREVFVQHLMKTPRNHQESETFKIFLWPTVNPLYTERRLVRATFKQFFPATVLEQCLRKLHTELKTSIALEFTCLLIASITPLPRSISLSHSCNSFAKTFFMP